MIKTIALCGTKPGLGPAAEILSLRRQRKNSKKGDPGVVAPAGARLCSTKNGKIRNSPAAQTAALLFPFSVLHKRRRHMGTAKVKNNGNSNVNATIAVMIPD
ncbi:MAG: hypothetical protein V4495_27890 [Pseudomonadota bacterium]